MPEATPILGVRDLVVEYPSTGWRRPPKRVLHEVSLDIGRGEALGLVGESGSGKTTLGRAILGLVPVADGEVTYQGEVISRASAARRRQLASELQVVFQDPYSSLNPAMTIGDILGEPLRAGGVSGGDARRRIRALLDDVQLPADAADRYPSEFSGGQRQRIAIARALALSPKFIVCDEPVSALDLSTQARVLDLLVDIQERTDVSLLIITHDLSVVRRSCHRVAVMHGGRIVEHGATGDVIEHPQDPYTRRLLLSAPVADQAEQRRRRAARRALERSDDVERM